MSLESHFIHSTSHDTLSNLLLIVGTGTATSLTLQSLDLYLAIFLKITSILSFGCYLIMNFESLKYKIKKYLSKSK